MPVGDLMCKHGMYLNLCSRCRYPSSIGYEAESSYLLLRIKQLEERVRELEQQKIDLMNLPLYTYMKPSGYTL